MIHWTTHDSIVSLTQIGFQFRELFKDFNLDLWPRTSWWSWTIWFWTINNLEEHSKSNMLQKHYLNAHCSRSMFATCSWSNVFLNMVLEHIWLRIFFKIINGPVPHGPDHMVQEQLVLDHKSWPKPKKKKKKNQKKKHLVNCNRRYAVRYMKYAIYEPAQSLYYDFTFILDVEYTLIVRGYCTSYPQIRMFCALSLNYQHLLEK